MKDERPTHKELTKRIKVASETVLEGKLEIVNHSSVRDDAIELGYSFVIEGKETILKLLREIKPDDYIGRHPPEKVAVKNHIKGADLFAFRCNSNLFKCEVYFKFVIKDGYFYLVSLHKNRRGK